MIISLNQRSESIWELSYNHPQTPPLSLSVHSLSADGVSAQYASLDNAKPKKVQLYLSKYVFIALDGGPQTGFSRICANKQVNVFISGYADWKLK